MDDIDDVADEAPQATGRGPADPPGADPVIPPVEPAEISPPADGVLPEFVARKPGLYRLRPQGLRPAPRPLRKRSGRLRNDCPPDRRRASNRTSPRPRLR